MITPISFNSIHNQTYTVFAVINGFMVPCVYFFFPETAYRSLEEMDTIFHKVHGLRGVFTVVKQAQIEPRRYGKHGELLINFDDIDDKVNLGRSQHLDESASDGSKRPNRPADKGVFAPSDEESANSH